MSKKEDGIINWVTPKRLGFLPSDIERDALSVLIRILIGKVKEDHARSQYKKELRHYASEITEIVKFVKENGYRITDVNSTKYADAYKVICDDGENQEEVEDKIISAEPSGNVIIENLSNISEQNSDYSEIVDG